MQTNRKSTTVCHYIKLFLIVVLLFSPPELSGAISSPIRLGRLRRAENIKAFHNRNRSVFVHVDKLVVKVTFGLHQVIKWMPKTRLSKSMSEITSKVLTQYWKLRKMSSTNAYSFVDASTGPFPIFDNPVFLAWIHYVKTTQEKPMEKIVRDLKRKTPMGLFLPALLQAQNVDKTKILADELAQALFQSFRFHKGQDTASYILYSLTLNKDPLNTPVFSWWLFFRSEKEKNAKQELLNFFGMQYGLDTPEKILQTAEEVKTPQPVIDKLQRLLRDADPSRQILRNTS